MRCLRAFFILFFLVRCCFTFFRLIRYIRLLDVDERAQNGDPREALATAIAVNVYDVYSVGVCNPTSKMTTGYFANPLSCNRNRKDHTICALHPKSYAASILLRTQDIQMVFSD